MPRLPNILCLFRLPTKLRRRARRSRILTMLALLFLTLSLITPFYIIYKPPSLLIRYFAHRWPDVLWHVRTTEKVVALTIDDAPSSYTQEILSILKENEATATFFVIGSQAKEKEDKKMLREMVEAGMELGNHAMHDEASRSLTTSTLLSQIEAVDAIISTAYEDAGIERTARYFRPGSGFFSEKMRELARKMNYRLVLGDIYPHDPQISYPKVNARHILSMLKPGAIIVCHDRREWTVPMLRKVVPEIKKKGYRIVTVSGLVGVGGGEGKGSEGVAV